MRGGSDGEIKGRDVRLGTVVVFQWVTEQVCTSRKMAVMWMRRFFNDVSRITRCALQWDTFVSRAVHEALGRPP